MLLLVAKPQANPARGDRLRISKAPIIAYSEALESERIERPTDVKKSRFLRLKPIKTVLLLCSLRLRLPPQSFCYHAVLPR